MRQILFAGLLTLAVILSAFKAAFAVDASTAVDLTPLVNNVVWPLITAVALALGGWAVQRLSAWLGLKNTVMLQDTVNAALQNGLAFAQSKVAGMPLSIDVKNQIVATAATYAIDHAPDALKKLGIDQTALVEKLVARLSINTTPPELSVAVPTPPLGA